jgi:hypothetical protein
LGNNGDNIWCVVVILPQVLFLVGGLEERVADRGSRLRKVNKPNVASVHASQICLTGT